jgi:hypothetical protein
MRRLEAVPALFILALAAFVFFGTSGANYWDGVTPGSRFFPAALAIVSVVAAAALLWAQRSGLERIIIDLPDAAGARRGGLSLGALVALAASTPVVGFTPMIAIFALFMLLAVLRQRLLPSAATAAIVAGFVELIFVRWLAVPLPAPFWT